MVRGLIMKKNIWYIFVLVLILTACVPQELDEAESEAEISTEIKDTQKPLLLQMDKDDIAVKMNVIQFVLESLNPIDPAMINNITVNYEDFNDDGVVDAVCYAPSKQPFSEIVFVTTISGKFTVIPHEIEDFGPGTHDVRKDGDFVLYNFSGGGTGMNISNVGIHKFNGEKIVNTEAVLTVDGYDSHPPKSSTSEGYAMSFKGEIMDRSYKVNQESNWYMFEYISTQTDDIKEEIVLQTDDLYTFNPQKFKYSVSQMNPPVVNNKTGVVSQVNDEGVYDIKELAPGHTLENFLVKNAYYNVNEGAGFTLEGPIKLNGCVMVDEMYGDYVFYADESMIAHPIRIQFLGVNYDLSMLNQIYFDQKYIDSFTKEQRDYLEEKQVIKVEIEALSYSEGLQFESEGGASIEITKMTVVDELDPHYQDSEYYESTAYGKLVDIDDELFITDQDGEIVVDYSQYRCVIIPMQETINVEKAPETLISFEGNDLNELKLTIFGKLQDVKITNIRGQDDIGETQEIDFLNNTTLIIMADLPSDMSHVIVTGRFHDGEGYYKNVEFTLDDMRDASAYKIVMFE